jgi:hypothetical protein
MQKVAMHFKLNADADEAAIMQAVDGLESKVTTLEADKLKMSLELNSLKEKEQDSLKMVVESKINDADKAGKISGGEEVKKEAKEALMTLGLRDLSAMEAILNSQSANIKKPVNMQAPTAPVVDESEKETLVKEWDSLEQKEGALMQLKSSDLETFDKLYAAKYK